MPEPNGTTDSWLIRKKYFIVSSGGKSSKIQIKVIKAGDGRAPGLFDFEEGFACSGLEGLPFNVLILFSHMSRRTAAEVGDFHVFHDIADGFGRDVGILWGKVFEAFAGLDEGRCGMGDAFFEAIH
jgi:hypothetical protein